MYFQTKNWLYLSLALWQLCAGTWMMVAYSNHLAGLWILIIGICAFLFAVLNFFNAVTVHD